MKLLFTRKTWYFFLLAAAAAGMADGFALLAGMDFSFLETLSFAACGISVLFLAAEKAPAQDAPPALAGKRPRGRPNASAGALFGCFAALLVSYILFGSQFAMRLTVFWPLWAWVELRRGGQVGRQLRLLVFSEVMQAALLLAANAGAGTALLATVFWVLLCAARGWTALALYRQKEDD